MTHLHRSCWSLPPFFFSSPTHFSATYTSTTYILYIHYGIEMFSICILCFFVTCCLPFISFIPLLPSLSPSFTFFTFQNSCLHSLSLRLRLYPNSSSTVFSLSLFFSPTFWNICHTYISQHIHFLFPIQAPLYCICFLVFSSLFFVLTPQRCSFHPLLSPRSTLHITSHTVLCA